MKSTKLPVIAFAITLITISLLFAPSAKAQGIYITTYVAADGAVGTNAAWEAGKSSSWYPELQRVGADYIEQGIAQENPTVISQGLLILDWGFSKEASDGSFPGCGNPAITATNANDAAGAVFHTTSLFFEGASRAVLDLRAYHPVTYTLNPTTYTSKLASYSTKLESTAKWLTNTQWTPPGASAAISVPAAGYAYDANYTHRYALLAAGLQECSNVTGDANLITETYGVDWWIDQYFTKQLGTGWTGAIPASTLNGDGNTPATLVAPGGTAPAGTGESISALGVLPETFGYDVSYQMVDALHFSHWYDASSDSTRKAKAPAIITNALQWERSRESIDGVIDITGSSRVGVETNQNGVGIKGIDTPSVIAAFAAGGAIDGKGRDILGGIRVADSDRVPSSDPIDTKGAIGSNASYDSNQSNGYDIANQKDCALWMAWGVKHENDTQIQMALNIMQWGFARQASNGSFPLTPSLYTDTATFLEAAAHTVLMLENYHPISHSLNMSLLSGLSSYIAAVNRSADYLCSPSMINSTYVSKTSAYKIFTYAAALGESAVVAQGINAKGSATDATNAASFVSKGIALQLSDGTDGEAGVFNPNFQATSIGMGEDLYQEGTLDATTKGNLKTSVSKALVKEESVVNPDGTFTFSSPGKLAIQNDFQTGAQLFSSAPFNVYYERISVSPLTAPV